MQLSTIQPEPKKIKQYYFSEEKKFYYQGQILREYDWHGNFIRYVKINKFTKHKKYLGVNLQDLKYKTKNMTLNADVLSKYYKGEGES